jgi:hypothetical protein
MLSEEVWMSSDECYALFQELCKEHSCGEYSPEKIREKIKKERDQIIRSKNLLCPYCENSSKRFTPEGLFSHFQLTHPDLHSIQVSKKLNKIEREDYGIMLGKISLDRINSTADMIEKNRMWEYLLDNILGRERYRHRSAHKMYVDLCEKKFGSIQNYTKELMEKFSFDEVSQMYYHAEANEDEYKEEVKRNDYIEKILTHFSDGINSVKHFSENATQTYGKIFMSHFPKNGSIENPSQNVLSEFSTEDLRVVVSNFNGRF